MVHIIAVHLPNLSTCSPNLNRGNTLLRYLLVSLSQAIGATTPFFDAISTFLLTCNKEFAEVYCALMPVVFVIVLASNNEPLFYLLGFLVCIGSTARRALKSVVQWILLTSKAEKLNSMNLLVYMAPMVASIFLPHTLYICWFMRLLSSIKHQQSFSFWGRWWSFIANGILFIPNTHHQASTTILLKWVFKDFVDMGFQRWFQIDFVDSDVVYHFCEKVILVILRVY